MPETLLLTLYNRAVESQRPDAIIRDEQAVELVQRLDYDFRRFGRGHASHPIRARVMDDILHSFLARHPDAVVINLGAGLDTQFFRVGNASVRWYEIDLPESIALRRQFFTENERYQFVAGSVGGDAERMDLVPPDTPLMVLAAGLLMYFTADEVKRLITTLAERFPGAEMQFDTITRWFSNQSLVGKARLPGGFVLPPMPWGINGNQITQITTWHPAIKIVQARDYTIGYRRRWGVYGHIGAPPIRYQTDFEYM
ncbi:MAG: class I SAM-dependent methyltransferase [Chloroflexaceae bacterium]|nr:class I SAM-dependent methyltransferase [Chloroflexaceae bacterium]